MFIRGGSWHRTTRCQNQTALSSISTFDGNRIRRERKLL